MAKNLPLDFVSRRWTSGYADVCVFCCSLPYVSMALAGDELLFEYLTGFNDSYRDGVLRIEHFEANPAYEEPA